MPPAPLARTALLLLAGLLALAPATAGAEPRYTLAFDFDTSPGYCCGATQALARAGNAFAVGVATDFGGYVSVRDAETGAERHRFTWPAYVDYFGFAVDASPYGLLVGGPRVLDGTGGAFVYRSLASAAPDVTLVSPEAGEPGGWFGKAVAWTGHDVVIGNPQRSGIVYGAGVAHLFDGRSGAHRARMASPDPHEGAAFGDVVAACHSGVAIAEPGIGTLAGAVHFFDRDGGYRQTLTAPIATGGDTFGANLACSGRWIAIGAPQTPGGGAVYLAKRERGRWRIVATLSGGPYGAVFGTGMVLEGRRLLLGSSATDTAYLFDARTGALLESFAPPVVDPEGFDVPYAHFGSDVAFVGRTIVVGTETYDENYRAHVFGYRARPPR